MNKDQIQGTIKDIAGKVQEKTGELIDSDEQQTEGLKKQITGKIQRVVGDVKEVIKSK